MFGDRMAAALRSLTQQSWHLERGQYECRLGHAEAESVQQRLRDVYVDATLDVSYGKGRAPRARVLVQPEEFQHAIDAAQRRAAPGQWF